MYSEREIPLFGLSMHKEVLLLLHAHLVTSLLHHSLLVFAFGAISLTVVFVLLMLELDN